MTVSRILGNKKGDRIYTCKQDETVESLTRILAEHRIGVILIVDDTGGLAGIVSERDIVRSIASDGAKALKKPASDVMTSKVFTCSPSDAVTRLMGLMTENRIRHLPVVVDGKIEGVISIGDVVKARIEAAEREAAEMAQYISSGF